MAYKRFPGSDIYCVRGPLDDGYIGSGWELFHVPGKDYGEEPMSFLVKKSSLSNLTSYYEEPDSIRRRSVSEFRRYDPSWPLIMDRYLKSRESYNPASRPSRRSHYDYGTVNVDDYATYSRTPSMRKPLPPARIPILYKASVPFLHKIRYNDPDSTGEIFEAKRRMKSDSVSRDVLKQDLKYMLHNLYAAKARANVRSLTDFNYTEIQRLDRKRDQLSKYIQDFKLDTVKQRLPLY